MKSAELERLDEGNAGTFGCITFGDNVLFTGELPDRDNRPNVSRIPAGLYLCKWTWSPHFGRMMYLITDVQGRSGIRIHSANFMGDKSAGMRSQLYGCVALGMKIGTLAGQRAILVSKTAVRHFETYMNGEDFELWIY